MGGFLEGDFHVIPQIIPALGLTGITLTASEQVFKDAAASEHLAEYLKRVVESCASAEAAGAPVECSVTVLVVSGPLLLDRSAPRKLLQVP